MQIKLSEHFWYRWDKRKDFMLKEGITPEKIIEFVLNPDLTFPDPIYPNREW
ncbi:hypothetical protein [Aquifex aeolicus]|uniref:hypothetical protein n=1 Tax=Aquifex aeolicus TaxID=63363 RepID=UPI0002ED9CF2|nr:hypothetical protein [Aquifex aeolicus]